MKRLFSLSLMSISLSACSVFIPLKEGTKVKIVKTEPVYCKDLGTLKAYGANYQSATNKLRNMIAKKGGNRVYLLYSYKVKIRPIPIGIMARYMYGRGFYCK